MAFLNIPNVKIAGIAAGVPLKQENYREFSIPLSTEYDNNTFIEKTGVEERRVDENLTTSDLCFGAAKQLVKDLNWDLSDIEALIVVTQFPDFIAPATACLLQDKLNLPKSCIAFDIELGCSGWIYGLSVVASLMRNGEIKKALLMAGDGRRNYVGSDKHAGPLFGHAGTVTALEYVHGEEGIKFNFGTDGSGFEALYIKGGGSRYRIDNSSLNEFEEDGKIICDLSSRMNGMDVFSFGISVPPKSIKDLLNKYDLNIEGIDYLILHQANMQINNKIVKKLGVPTNKVPESLSKFGNTSSASIPLTMVTALGGELKNGSKNLLCCGFGIGLSWGSAWIHTNDLVVSPLVEVRSDENML